MSQPQIQTSTAVSPSSLSWLPASRATRFALAVVLGSAFLAAAAHISFPLFFTPVPFTLQPFAVLLLALLLDPAVAFATLFAYLVEGASGLPVFAPTSSATAFHLMGPSGGYLLSYPFAALLVSKLYRIRRPASFTFAALCAAAGAIVYFACGASWLSVVMHQPASIALKLAVWPFLAGDALKVILAAAIVTGFSRWRSRQNSETAPESAHS
jgi:biotin transport system substrate-specific component